MPVPAGGYQASGAHGFRDQLQDDMALVAARSELTREHPSPAAARQFVEGDVQDWWLPHSGKGVRTQISDDRPWLAYAVPQYVEATQDKLVLDPMAREHRVVDGVFQFEMRVSAPVGRIVDLCQWIW